MLERFKPLFNSVLRPLAGPADKIGIRPNHLTLTGLAFFIVASWLVYKGSWTTACIIAIIGSLFDGLDGVLARESNETSAFGAILDSCCDRMTEIFLLAGILGYFLTSPHIVLPKESLSLSTRAWGIVFCYSSITLSLMVSYIKARCEGAGISCSRGLLQRPERIILLCAGLLMGPSAMMRMLAVISLLAAVTVLQRFVEAFRGAKIK
jgi:CDP-diacylglycerol--glycerol-3-phosphate 3-phosphatidyltransferase